MTLKTRITRNVIVWAAVSVLLGQATAADESTLTPATSPKEAVTKWLAAIQSERDTKDIVDSPLIAVSPYCPSEKLDRYISAIDEFRESIASHVVDDAPGEAIQLGHFGGAVVRLNKPGEPAAKTVIAVAALKTNKGWKVPVGINHFDNVFYGFDKKLRQQQADVTRQLSALRRATSKKSEQEIADEMRKLIRDTRKTLQLDTLEPEQLALQFVYPKSPLTDIERLSFLALSKNSSAADLRIALEVARDINLNTSANLPPNNAEQMAGILALRARARRHGVDLGQAPEKLPDDDQPAEVKPEKNALRPLAEMPWPADASGTRRFREPSAIALMLPQSVRKEFGDLPEPYIEIVEKFVSEDGKHMAISLGLFDHVIPGRFAVLPVYLRKTGGQWTIAIPDSTLFRGHEDPERMNGGVLTPNDELLEWYYENNHDLLDKFCNSVVDFADNAGETQKFETAGELVEAYVDAVTRRDLLRCLRLTGTRSKAFSKDLEDLLSALQHSFEILDPAIFEIHPADPKYAVQTHKNAAMLWLTRITRSTPGVIVTNAVITENVGDGDGWKISPGIHEVFPISARPNLEERKTLPIDEKLAAALAKLDQLRIAKEEEIRDVCVADLFNHSTKIDKIDTPSINSPSAPDLTEAQALVDELAKHHIEGDIADLINRSASLKSENPKDYYQVLRDIGNDSAFFRVVGDHLEAIDSDVEGRWLGIIVRDSRMPDRTGEVDSPTTKDTLSMRLFVRHNDRWIPLLGGGLLKEINSGMKWINQRLVTSVSNVIGNEEITAIKTLKTILDKAPADTRKAPDEAK